tara:strand:+ start:1526 stop:2899 length:1374 start_codon:yes stop_codon:yes gene_type:complete
MTSTIKVNTIQNTCGADIIKESGNTITIGASGDTVTLGSGASQTGFGRTGTVDWQTGSIKTATFTAANGEGYFCNTTSGGFTVNLPAGSAGAIVSVQDYNNTFDSNALTIAPNGSEKINGGDGGGVVALSTEGEGLTLVYIDSTVGWRSIQDSDFAASGSSNIVASGGTVTTCGDCKIHTFTSPGTFSVSAASATAAENIVSYLVIAGGGGSAEDNGGGGGAGGYRELKSPITPYTASPLDGYPSAPLRVTVTAQDYPITVGAGGAGSPNPGGANAGLPGSNSIFSTITSAGGGGGGGDDNADASNGGSGGGGGGRGGSNPPGKGSGNTPPVSPPQGNDGGNGGTSPAPGAGGGGGAGGAGSATPSAPNGGAGGTGATTGITGSNVTRAGGGGGGSGQGGGSGGAGGSGGGGAGSASNTAGVSGTANTGGGGGGGGQAGGSGGSGGSGIVVIRYKFQ